MGEGGSGWWGGGPAMAPLNVQREEERWRHFDSSVNAVSFGFVATAILISMFLVMAIFERFLRPRQSPELLSSPTPAGRGGWRRSRRGMEGADLEAQQHRGDFAGKLDHPSPKMSVYAKGVSVLMPGQDVPTFIAHPVPAPCPPERISWPVHQQQVPISGSNSSLS